MEKNELLNKSMHSYSLFSKNVFLMRLCCDVFMNNIYSIQHAMCIHRTACLYIDVI